MNSEQAYAIEEFPVVYLYEVPSMPEQVIL